MIGKRFGWWPRNSTIDARVARVDLLPTFDASAAVIKNDPRAYDGWYYPPLEPVRGSSGETKSRPNVPAGIYELPLTHRITGSESWVDEDYLHFVIALIGLVDGMRLLPEGWQHFYRTPIRPCKLTDLVCDHREIAEVVYVATAWWKARTTDERRAMFAAIHWFCFSGLYHHEFEEFSAKYTVLDTLYWIHRKGEVKDPHSERPLHPGEILRPKNALLGSDGKKFASVRFVSLV